MVLLACAVPALAHPKPGAHADVRIEIGSGVVRVDALMNVLFVDGLIAVPRARRDQILPDEMEAVLRGVAEYCGGQRAAEPTLLVDEPNRVWIDGIEVAPVVRELRVVTPEPETRPGFIQNPVLLMPRVHLVAEYSAKAPPKEVRLRWGTYPRDFLAEQRDVPPPGDIEAVLTSHGDLRIVMFTHSEPEVTWTGEPAGTDRFEPVPEARLPDLHAVPVLSLLVLAAGCGVVACYARRTSMCWTRVCAAGTITAVAFVGTRDIGVLNLPASLTRRGEMTDEAALAIFSPLHANVYRAFDYEGENEVYDSLARSVDGPLLDAMYRDIHRGLVMEEEGGAVARVQKVSRLDAIVEAGSRGSQSVHDAFTIATRWRVEGVVYHWGHSHHRTNEYEGKFEIAARPQGWRVVAYTPTASRRIQTPLQAASEAAAASVADSPIVPHSRPGAPTWRPNR